MRKFITVILILSLALAITSNAIAIRTPFHIVTDSTTEFKTGASGITKTGDWWYLSINMNTSNISETHRAVTRVHHGFDAASATWVYSGPNATNRMYSADYLGYQENLSFRGRLDNRDSGILEFHGDFVHSLK